MLHACEILFSGFVRDRILALPNKALAWGDKREVGRGGAGAGHVEAEGRLAVYGLQLARLSLSSSLGARRPRAAVYLA